MFVMAAMSAGTCSGPVKIRNLSASGALIEGASLPSVGTEVTLRRANSSASGRIVWCSGGKAGLHLNAHVQVSDWMPGAQTHQNSIDHLVETVKKETRLAGIASTPAPPSILGAGELLSLADSICILADGLAGEEDILVRYASKLQTLDLAAQVLRKLAAER